MLLRRLNFLHTLLEPTSIALHSLHPPRHRTTLNLALPCVSFPTYFRHCIVEDLPTASAAVFYLDTPAIAFGENLVPSSTSRSASALWYHKTIYHSLIASSGLKIRERDVHLEFSPSLQYWPCCHPCRGRASHCRTTTTYHPGTLLHHTTLPDRGTLSVTR